MCQVDRLSSQLAQAASPADSLASDVPGSDSIFDALAQACSSGRAVNEAEILLDSGTAMYLACPASNTLIDHPHCQPLLETDPSSCVAKVKHKMVFFNTSGTSRDQSPLLSYMVKLQ